MGIGGIPKDLRNLTFGTSSDDILISNAFKNAGRKMREKQMVQVGRKGRGEENEG